MKIDKTSIFTLVLIFGLIASIAYIFQLKNENKAFQKSKSIVNDQLEEIKATKSQEIDCLDEQKAKILDSIEILKAEKETIEINLSKLDKKQIQDEKTIRNMHNADSIQQLFTKYYPDHD